MSKIIFTKMHGLGNDYIYINVLKNKDLREVFTRYKVGELVRYLSNRNFGIGGDGVIFIEPSNMADFKMRIFNSDGTEAEMCGNGIRCFAKYVREEGLTSKDVINIETLAGIKEVKIIQTTVLPNNEAIDEYIVKMGTPKYLGDLNLKIVDKEFKISRISIGNPHAVIFVKDVEELEIEKYAPSIENNRYFPQRTNVEFVEILDKNLIKIRTWERGSKETFACGTGSCAAVAVGMRNKLLNKNVKVLLKGGELNIKIDEKTNEIFMKGIATRVFDGYIYV